MQRSILALVLVTLIASCSSVSTVRVQPENVEAGPGLRAIAAIQADAVSWYLLFVPIPGGVSLDRVVNRMLIVAAKTMGADKIVNLRFSVTPDTGAWSLLKLFLFRRATASGIAVQVETPTEDPDADDGPEPPVEVTPAGPAPPAAPPRDR